MQVAPPDDQMLNQSKVCHLVAKYATSTSSTIWWSNLQLMHVVPSANFQLMQVGHLVAKFATNVSGAIWWPNLQLLVAN